MFHVGASAGDLPAIDAGPPQLGR
ncbi:MAG: hypothetical protein QOI88_3699, partial [Gammaproteobacteria bacterium]|nr:hypothetical protein [Gammaproteobacteria bacterium]